MTNEQIKINIDTDITNKTQVKSISPANVGENMKSIVDYVDQENTLTYKEYISLISQSGTNDPVEQVLKNDFETNISWVRDSEGIYTGTLNGAFINFKTVAFISSISFVGGYEITSPNENTIRIRTANLTSFDLTDGFLNETAINIKVFN